jgi:hypothetical protein
LLTEEANVDCIRLALGISAIYMGRLLSSTFAWPTVDRPALSSILRMEERET